MTLAISRIGRFGRTVDRQVGSRRSNATRSRGDRVAYALFLVPVLALICGLVLYPIEQSIATSLHAGNGSKYIGLANYRRFFHDRTASAVVFHTFIRGVGGVVPSYILGLLAALALHKRIKFGKTFRVLAFVPFVISAPVGLNMWRLLLDPQTGVPAALGIHMNDIFSNSHLVWPALIFINTWGSFQFYAMILLAGLAQIPDELYEAADVDGVNWWSRFRYVTMPSIATISLVACALHFLASFQDFNLISILTGGGPLGETNTLATYAYTSAFSNYDDGYATTLTAISMVIMLIALVAAGVAVLLLRRLSWARRARASRRIMSVPLTDTLTTAKPLHRPQSARERRNGPFARFGRSARPYCAAGLVSLIGVLPILFVLSRALDSTPGGTQATSILPRHWSISNFTQVLKSPALWSRNNIAQPPLALNFLNSIIVAGATTVLVLLVGMLGGYSLSRWGSRFAQLSIGLMLVVGLVPVIVLVFPLYELLAKFGLLDTRQGLILATSALAVPGGTLFFKTFFDRLPRELEESASLDGAGVLRTWWTIVLPLSRPIIGAVSAFTLINAWNEYLLAKSLISDNNVRTFPPALQQYMSSYTFASVNSPGVQAVYLLIPIAAALVLLAATQQQLARAYQGGALKG